MGMRQILGKLAGQTAIYGTSTIVARFLNYMLLPLYTYTLSTSDYGVLTEFMSYIAVFQVLLTMGLETGCFRFASKEGYEPRRVFSGALAAVSTVSAVFLLLMILFGRGLAERMGYGGYWNIYIYIGVILFSDCFTAILFAKLRQENRAWRFAIFKVVKILAEAGSNLLLFLWYPGYAAAHPDNLLSGLIPAVPDFSYPIFSILVSCVLCFALFIPEMLRLGLGVDRRTLKNMLRYSLPLMVAGLPGVINDFLDRILFRFFNVDDSLWRADLGVYQAAVKVAVIMSLFVQMFRFAAEPFFFSNTRQKDFKRVYASVMEYFVMFCMLIFLGVTFYLDIIQLIVGSDFREGMGIVPVMLLAYMMMGMLFNVSMWYKLSDRPSFAIYITAAGLVVTAVINIVFLPVYSYHAAAWGHFFSYLTMLVLSVLLGRKYYSIPYRWGKITDVIILGLVLYSLDLAIPDTIPFGWTLTVRTLLIGVYLAGLFYIEKHFRRHKLIADPFPLPAYATEQSAGMDLRASISEPLTLNPLQRELVPTGLYIELPAGFEAQIRPRSGLAIKHGISLVNTPGTVDADYRGEIKVILVNLSNEPFTLNPGERIAQMVVARHEKVQWDEVEVLEESARGEGGFGSTGRK